jgi:acyl-CoA synthetase (NDP forming)
VITAGYAETGLDGRVRQRELVREARAAGMRVLGPNAFGLINTDPAVRLDASLAPQLPGRGPLGVFTQSGAIGAALLEAAYRRGLGISSFASAGNRADVSGNDLLQYWEEDEDTGVALLYLESFGNPRKFSRLARRLAACKPLVVVKGGRDTRSIPAGQAAAATRMADSTVDTLFQQAGVIRVDTITELYDTADLLAHQPLPRGPRIAIVGNSDSLGLLTHDAALGAGLQPLLPHDLTTSATPHDFRRGLTAAIERPDSDAVVAVVIPPIGAGGFPHFPGSGLLAKSSVDGAATPLLDLAPFAAALGHSARLARAAGKPLLVVHLALPELVDGIGAAEAGERSEPAPGEADSAPAQAHPGGAGLATAGAPSPDEADAAAPPVADGIGRVPGYPRPERAVRALTHAVRYAAWRAESTRERIFPDFEDVAEPQARAIVAEALGRQQEMVLDDVTAARLLACYGVTAADHAPDEDGAVETTISASVDPAVGAILSFGLAGVASELLGDVAHRLIPATGPEVASLIREVKAAPLLFGWHGSAPVDTGALEELLSRVSQLVDDLPEVASLTLRPVRVAPRGLTVLGAGVRLARLPARTDLGPRALA